MKKKYITIEKEIEVSLEDFENKDVIEYVESDLHKVVLDPEDLPADNDDSHVPYSHPSDYIDTPDELREHLIQILGLGHYVTNADIVNKVQGILQ